MTEKLGLRVVIDGNEKDLDDIFLKISDYQSGEAVVLTQETGIKYIDVSGVKRDLIERYIGYDSDGYVEGNYEADPNRIGPNNLVNIKDKNNNNLVDLFYQLGTKKIVSENLIEISNGIYYVRVKKKNSNKNSNYKFNFNFPNGTIIWMEISNNNVYIKDRTKTHIFLEVTYNNYNILSSSHITLYEGRHTGGDVYNTFLRNHDTQEYYLSRSNVNKLEAKCIIIG